ncbi:MAG: YqaJ viral recombinase family protein [Spirochaetia bacterium]
MDYKSCFLEVIDEKTAAITGLARHEEIERSSWADNRATYLGGTDAHAILSEGDYQWSTPFTVWCKKNGLKKDLKTNAMTKGIEREPVIRALASELIKQQCDKDVKVYESPFLYRSQDAPYLGANIDGVAIDKDGLLSILEIKTTSYKWESIPDTYLAQVQHYMDVLNIFRAFLVVEFDGHYNVFQIYSEDGRFERMAKMRDFWMNYVLKKTPPPLSGYPEIEAPYLDLLNRKKEGGIVMRGDLEHLAQEYLSLGKAEKEIEKKRATLALELKEALGGAKEGYFGGIVAKYLHLQRESFDTQVFKEECPELYRKYVKKTEYSQLRVG